MQHYSLHIISEQPEAKGRSRTIDLIEQGNTQMVVVHMICVVQIEDDCIALPSVAHSLTVIHCNKRFKVLVFQQLEHTIVD
jgi:hypothetical protein